jgi:hypothetical protein
MKISCPGLPDSVRLHQLIAPLAEMQIGMTGGLGGKSQPF